jgi:hypothetical protein
MIGSLLVFCLAAPGALAGELKLTSKAFLQNGGIPQKYTKKK